MRVPNFKMRGDSPRSVMMLGWDWNSGAIGDKLEAAGVAAAQMPEPVAERPLRRGVSSIRASNSMRSRAPGVSRARRRLQFGSSRRRMASSQSGSTTSGQNRMVAGSFATHGALARRTARRKSGFAAQRSASRFQSRSRSRLTLGVSALELMRFSQSLGSRLGRRWPWSSIQVSATTS